GVAAKAVSGRAPDDVAGEQGCWQCEEPRARARRADPVGLTCAASRAASVLRFSDPALLRYLSRPDRVQLPLHRVALRPFCRAQDVAFFWREGASFWSHACFVSYFG